ncbi:ankyrin repeat-containing domain protein [Aspergillus crustosus]
MPLLNPPNELLLNIADYFEYSWDLNALCLASRDLYTVLNPYLYRESFQYTDESILRWAAEHGNEVVVRRQLDKALAFSDFEIAWIDDEQPEVWGDERWDLVRLVLELGADVNAQDGCLKRPLLYAAKQGEIPVICCLLEYAEKANPERHLLDLEPIQCIFTAAKHGKIEAARTMLEIIHSKVPPTEVKIQGALLASAAACWSERIVQDLLLKGHDPYAISRCEDRYCGFLHDPLATPIDFAAMFGHENVTKLLFDNGAQPRGSTLLEIVRRSKSVPVTKMLLDAGVQPCCWCNHCLGTARPDYSPRLCSLNEILSAAVEHKDLFKLLLLERCSGPNAAKLAAKLVAKPLLFHALGYGGIPQVKMHLDWGVGLAVPGM